MKLQTRIKLRLNEAEITEIIYAGELIGSLYLIYSPDSLEGYSQINTDIIKKIRYPYKEKKRELTETNSEITENNSGTDNQTFDNQNVNNNDLNIDDLMQETQEFIINYVQNQAAAADKKIIHVRHCQGTWEENEQIEFIDESFQFPKVNENILAQFIEAEVNDVKIIKSSEKIKIGILLQGYPQNYQEVGQVLIKSRGTSNEIKVDFWFEPTMELTFHATTFLITLRGEVAGGRIDFYHKNKRLKSGLIPSPK